MVAEIDGLEALEAGTEGGAMERRLALLPAREGLALLGVVVREAEPEDPVDPSCLVGDLLGDCVC